MDAHAQELRALIAYDDLAAGHRAMRLLLSLESESEGSFRFKPQPWRFDLIADPDWNIFAVDDALKADLLLISASSAETLPEEIHRWVAICLAQKRGAHAAVVALFGPDGNRDDAQSPRLRKLERTARTAGYSFFSPGQASRKDLRSYSAIENARVLIRNKRWEINE